MDPVEPSKPRRPETHIRFNLPQLPWEANPYDICQSPGEGGRGRAAKHPSSLGFVRISASSEARLRPLLPTNKAQSSLICTHGLMKTE